jgi:hypothetical protein
MWPLLSAATAVTAWVPGWASSVVQLDPTPTPTPTPAAVAPGASCSPFDLSCQAAQSVSTSLDQFAQTLGQWFAGMLNGALNADSSVKIFQSGDKTGSFANAGFAAQFGFWLTIMAAVLLVVALGQIIIAMVNGNLKHIGRIGGALLISVPVTLFALLLMEQANDFVNDVTNSFLAQLEGTNGGSLTNAVLNITGLSAFDVAPYSSGSPWLVGGVTGGAGLTPVGVLAVGGSSIMTILIMLLLMVACGFLAIAMLVRVFGLAVLAVVAPIALMFIGQPKFHAWAKGWVEIVIGLLLAKPLAAAVIGVAIAIVQGDPTNGQQATGQTTTDFFGVIAGFVGLLVAAASPIATIALCRFTGNELERAVAHRHTPGSVVGKVTQAVGGASYARQRLAASRSLTNSRNATRGTGSRSAANPVQAGAGARASGGATPSSPAPAKRGQNAAPGSSSARTTRTEKATSIRASAAPKAPPADKARGR